MNAKRNTWIVLGLSFLFLFLLLFIKRGVYYLEYNNETKKQKEREIEFRNVSDEVMKKQMAPIYPEPDQSVNEDFEARKNQK